MWLGLRDVFPHPYGLGDALGFIALAGRMDPRTYFAIEVDGELAGGIGYIRKTDVERIGAEVGYWLGRAVLGPRHRHRGAAAPDRARLRRDPELRRLWAVPFASNVASARVLEKAGYTREGTLRQSAIKDGRVLDQFMYAIVRDEPRSTLRHAGRSPRAVGPCAISAGGPCAWTARSRCRACRSGSASTRFVGLVPTASAS